MDFSSQPLEPRVAQKRVGWDKPLAFAMGYVIPSNLFLLLKMIARKMVPTKSQHHFFSKSAHCLQLVNHKINLFFGVVITKA